MCRIVGVACQTFSATFRQSRGMFFSLLDKGECLPMVYNWPSDDVDIIVVTDGSRILGKGGSGGRGRLLSNIHLHGRILLVGKVTLCVVL